MFAPQEERKNYRTTEEMNSNSNETKQTIQIVLAGCLAIFDHGFVLRWKFLPTQYWPLIRFHIFAFTCTECLVCLFLSFCYWVFHIPWPEFVFESLMSAHAPGQCILIAFLLHFLFSVENRTEKVFSVAFLFVYSVNGFGTSNEKANRRK